MQSTVIRAMTLADLDRVMEIAASQTNAPSWPRSAYVAAVGSGAEPRRVSLVAEDTSTSQVAGLVVARLMPPEAELETIVTATEFQRRGLARLLFGGLAAALKTAGVTDILLELRDSNQAAKALYESVGFIATGRRAAYYADPAEDAVLMRLKLGEGNHGQ
jgi:[ribosomal protein S18]-alanine N-acetyltransferase